MENQQLIYSKIDIENILIYIKQSKKFLVVSENIFLLIKNYLSKSKKLFLEYLKKYHKKSNSEKIISELDNLLSFEENKKLNYNIKPPSNLKSEFKFSLKNNIIDNLCPIYVLKFVSPFVLILQKTCCILSIPCL